MKNHGYISHASGQTADDGRPVCIVELGTSHRGGADFSAHRAEAMRTLRHAGFELPVLEEHADHLAVAKPDAVRWTFRALTRLTPL